MYNLVNFFFFLVFLGLHLCHMEVPGLGFSQSCSCWSTSQPRQILVPSATYTTAHGNTGFLTHWARPGIEPESSWILVRFITAQPLWELHKYHSEQSHYIVICLSLRTRRSFSIVPITPCRFSKSGVGLMRIFWIWFSNAITRPFVKYTWMSELRMWKKVDIRKTYFKNVFQL